MNSQIAMERISYVAKPDSITASQGDFLVTHVAIKRLLLLDKFDVMPSGGKHYMEEEIFKRYIKNPQNQHQFIVVYGQSGTGKSHLIRWFEARYSQHKPDDEVVLFIRRSDNTLKGTIRQLLEKPEIQGISNREVYERLVKASVTIDENRLKDTIYHNFIIEIHNDNDEHDIKITNVKRKRLEAFLYNEMVHDYLMSESGPIERMYSKIAEHTLVDRDTIAQFEPEDFYVTADLTDRIQRAGADPKAEKMARELMADESGKEEAKRIAEYMNQFVNDVIQRCAGIEPGDFKQVFLDIRKELYRLGKNLTLFIEDVTSFTGVDGALLDALMEEHTGVRNGDEICRISSVVGTTGNYLQHNFKDNHKDRITKYVYIPSDVLDEVGLYEFVGKYLNAMSLPEEKVNEWLKNHANPEDYPVHHIKEGTGWEYIECEYDKKLCLYPFTRRSILYLYEHGLTKGHQTPRYILRDIIEPTVNDILHNKDNFPSVKYNIASVNTTLSYMIHNQIKDEVQSDRILRFMSIWGDGKAEQYERDGVSYIAAIPKDLYKELGLPIINLQEVKPGTKPDPGTTSGTKQETSPRPELKPGPAVPPDKIKKLSEVNKILTGWTNGRPIDVSATGGTLGIIRAAKEDLCSYLFSSLNWQAQGISMDNIDKVKNSSAKLIIFENQTKGSGFYVLPANWNSLNLISAFVRWREYGNQSWNYPESDFDAYLITSWTASVEKELLNSVNEYKKGVTVNYIDAAVASEIYRLIITGEFRERSLKNLTTQYLFNSKPNKATENSHSREWNALLAVIKQKGADQTNRDTVRQYFNITQGSGGSVVVLDALGLSNTFRKVKTNKLVIAEEERQADDKVRLRKDAYSFLQDITDRLDSVAKAEVTIAREKVQFIYDHFEDDDIEEEAISELASRVKSFYEEINKTQINIPVVSADKVKKSATQIAKALHDIADILDDDDPLTIVMTFSGDPVSTLNPLSELLMQLDKDIEKVGKEIATRKAVISDVSNGTDISNRYQLEIDAIDGDIELIKGTGVRA
ncbi:MAG: ATP-binding protein [Lachnospira sp.]|nr:ATP-binding protein [Lachnospira sp.]